ncbi:MAG: sulfite exporter TauE/SafE family protein [Chthonomonas sp.]|nr:sulfite exporter TauE/SafE family protein [Chthonomonas sp.]
MEFVLCIVLGLIAGLSSGVFGIGGGILIVPALVLAFKFSQQKAQGTSLAALLMPVGIFAVMNYYRSGNADLKFGALIGAGYLGGAFFGSKIALAASQQSLSRAFGVFMIALGLWFIFRVS